MTKEKKSITLDDLAVMVKKGFDEVDARFDKVNGRFDEMETKAEADRRFGLIIDRFERVEADVRDIKGTLGFLVSAATEHERKFDQVEVRLRRLEYKAGFSKLK